METGPNVAVNVVVVVVVFRRDVTFRASSGLLHISPQRRVVFVPCPDALLFSTLCSLSSAFGLVCVNPLMSTGNYSATSNKMK